MHIQDGILSVEVCGAAAVISTGALAYSLHRVKSQESSRIVPLTGMMAALIFAGQMVNFPLIGTAVSGHLMGGVLAAAILGPWAACIAMSLVLIVQCLMFADGGLLSLGVNILHMAVVGSLGGWAIRETVRRFWTSEAIGQVAGAVVASWLTVLAAAALFCLEFGLSHEGDGYHLSRIFTLMVSIHSLIGIGEALITGIVVAFIWQHRPSLLLDAPSADTDYRGAETRDANVIDPAAGGRRSLRPVIISGLITALAIAAFLAPFASDFPDGFESVAERAGFDSLQTEPSLSVLSEYSIPAPAADVADTMTWEIVSISLAGIGGALTVFLIALILGRIVVRSGVPAHSST